MATRLVPTIVNGIGYSLALSDTGDVFSMGSGSSQGHGHRSCKVCPPKKISSLQNIKAIDCGFGHSACLDAHGNVFIFGSNQFGLLGIGRDPSSLPDTYKPQKIDLPPIKQVVCSGISNICVSEDGDIYSFGFNEYGQLGLGNTKHYNRPQKVKSLKNVDFVQCGRFHTICKTLNNEIYVWGKNIEGQLGIGSHNNEHSPVKCESWPNNIVDIKCGNNHTIVLTLDGDLYSCGSNEFYQLGRNLIDSDCSPHLSKIPTVSGILQVSCGEEYSMCINNNGDLFLFGANNFGQLGFGDYCERKEPTKNPLLSNIIDISSRGRHTFVKNSLNEIYAFGGNQTAQFGVKTRITELNQ